MLRYGGEGQEGFGIWRASASATKNRIPPPSAVADCGVLLPSAPSSSVFDLRTSAHPSFLLSPPLNMYWVGWGGRTRDNIDGELMPKDAIDGVQFMNLAKEMPESQWGLAELRVYGHVRNK